MKRKLICLILLVLVFTILSYIFILNNSKPKNSIYKYISNDKKTNTTLSNTLKAINVKSITISAAGDCTIGWDSNFGTGHRFDTIFKNENGDYSYFFRNVKYLFKNDDLTFVNFEGTFTDETVKVPKKFNFRAPQDYINILIEGDIDIVNLANNHSYDYGQKGFDDTVETFENSPIDYFGYDKYLIKEVKGVKIGFFGLIDIDARKYTEVKKAIDYLKANDCDLIIASMHWGIEKDYNQTQAQINLGHYMIDNGVDLVIGHHPHVIQGIEKYNGKYIIYSLANFSFGGNPNPPDKDTFIFQQSFLFNEQNELLNNNISIIPASISSTKSYNNYQPTVLEGDEALRVFNKIYSKSIGL